MNVRVRTSNSLDGDFNHFTVKMKYEYNSEIVSFYRIIEIAFVVRACGLSLDQPQLADDAGRVVVIAALDNHSVSDAHDAAVTHLHAPPAWRESAEAGVQRAGVRAAIGKFDDRPGVLHDDVDDLHLAIGESLAPAPGSATSTLGGMTNRSMQHAR